MMDFAKEPSPAPPSRPAGCPQESDGPPLPYLTWPRLHTALREDGGTAGITTRHGGVSPPPYGTANLGTDTADHPAAVRENRRRICTACGLPPSAFRCCRQVHGTRIIREEEPPGQGTPPEPAGNLFAADETIPTGDGLITNRPGRLLAVFTADCTPLILYDPRRRTAAALHAGWRGTAAGILGRGVQALNQAYGSRPEDLLLGIGPGVSGRRYEVGPEVRSALEESLNPAGKTGEWIYPEEQGVDVAQVNYLQALALGIPPDQIETAGPLCTLEREELFYSHRRDGSRAGRQAGFITLPSAPGSHHFFIANRLPSLHT